jgi:hypothetical protein
MGWSKPGALQVEGLCCVKQLADRLMGFARLIQVRIPIYFIFQTGFLIHDDRIG